MSCCDASTLLSTGITVTSGVQAGLPGPDINNSVATTANSNLHHVPVQAPGECDIQCLAVTFLGGTQHVKVPHLLRFRQWGEHVVSQRHACMTYHTWTGKAMCATTRALHVAGFSCSQKACGPFITNP